MKKIGLLLALFSSLLFSAEKTTDTIDPRFNSLKTEWKNSLGISLLKTSPESDWGATRMITRSEFLLFLSSNSLRHEQKVSIWMLKYKLWRKETLSFDQWKQWMERGNLDEPVVGISWNDAIAFCAWITEREKKAGLIDSDQCYRLPKDLEWSEWVGLKKESGTTPILRNKRIEFFPWGENETPPENFGNFAGKEALTKDWPNAWKTFPEKTDSFPRLAPCASFPKNPKGFYDLPGNAMEWTADLLKEKSTLRVIRGIPWYCATPSYMIVSRRLSSAPTYREEGLGFRIVLTNSLQNQIKRMPNPSESQKDN